ncbi:hypothetical protein ScPMuIL_002509 [Solemya velum]
MAEPSVSEVLADGGNPPHAILSETLKQSIGHVGDEGKSLFDNVSHKSLLDKSKRASAEGRELVEHVEGNRENVLMKKQLAGVSHKILQANETLREEDLNNLKKENESLKEEMETQRLLAESRKKELLYLSSKMDRMYANLSKLEQELQGIREEKEHTVKEEERREKEAAKLQMEETNTIILTIDSKIDQMSGIMTNVLEEIKNTQQKKHANEEFQLSDKIIGIVREKNAIEEEERKQRKQREAAESEIEEKNEQLLAYNARMAEMAKMIEDLQDQKTSKSNLVYRLRETERQVGDEKKENFKLFSKVTYLSDKMKDLQNENNRLQSQVNSVAVTTNPPENKQEREYVRAEQPEQGQSLSGPEIKSKKRNTGFLRFFLASVPDHQIKTTTGS